MKKIMIMMVTILLLLIPINAYAIEGTDPINGVWLETGDAIYFTMDFPYDGHPIEALELDILGTWFGSGNELTDLPELYRLDNTYWTKINIQWANLDPTWTWFGTGYIPGLMEGRSYKLVIKKRFQVDELTKIDDMEAEVFLWDNSCRIGNANEEIVPDMTPTNDLIAGTNWELQTIGGKVDASNNHLSAIKFATQSMAIDTEVMASELELSNMLMESVQNKLIETNAHLGVLNYRFSFFLYSIMSIIGLYCSYRIFKQFIWDGARQLIKTVLG